jgi:predicted deacylase
MENRVVARLAAAFGAELILDTPGERGMLRYEAARKGIACIVYEAGEPGKFEAYAIAQGVRGIRNVLADLKMLPVNRREPPPMHVVARDRRWLRATRGGVLVVRARPGEVVEKGEELAYHTKPFGTQVQVLRAPFRGLVVGVTTTPVAYPGSPVAHLVRLEEGQARMWRRIAGRAGRIASS